MKLFFTDLDSTLLNDEKTVSPLLREALIKMLSNGHKLTLASGRSLHSILKVKDSLDLGTDKGIFISAFNGSLIYDCANYS